MNRKTVKFLIFLTLFPIAIVLGQTQFSTDLEHLRSVDESLVAAYDKINIREAWEKIRNSGFPIQQNSVSIGVFDTGIYLLHKEFENVIVNTDTNQDFKTLLGFNIGHGTQVNGIIGANNKSPGAVDDDEMNGIMSGVPTRYALVSRYTAREEDEDFSFKATFDEVAPRVNVMNLSTGGAVRCSENFSRRGCIRSGSFSKDLGLFEKMFSAYTATTLLVLAAGNHGIDASDFLAAAVNLENTITVGATKLDDTRSTSNFGSVIALSAPGERVYAPRPPLTPFGFEGGYDDNFSGTSASAPIVTGVAGLIKSIKPLLTPPQIKQILIETADPIFASIGSDEAGKLLGSGCTAISTPAGQVQRGCRLNAEKAVCHPLVLNCAPSQQQVITSMTLFASDSSGALNVVSIWDTQPNDGIWVLGVATSTNETAPLLNNSDTTVSIPISGEQSLTLFGSDDSTFQRSNQFFGLNIFFNGSFTPGISAIGQLGTTLLKPNFSNNTIGHTGFGFVPGAGTLTFAGSNGETITLTNLDIPGITGINRVSSGEVMVGGDALDGVVRITLSNLQAGQAVFSIPPVPGSGIPSGAGAGSETIINAVSGFNSEINAFEE